MVVLVMASQGRPGRSASRGPTCEEPELLSDALKKGSSAEFVTSPDWST